MNLLNLIEASKSYDQKIILDSVNFSCSSGERIAVIGKNGGGKSTLLGLIAGDLSLDSGRRAVLGNLKISTLSQNLDFNPADSVISVIENSLKEIKQAHLELESISKKLDSENLDSANSKTSEFNPQSTQKSLLARYEELSNFLTAHNGWNVENRVSEVLEKFNLKEFENRAIGSLSGGEQKRVALSKILLENADLIILDEPTNHLDVQMTQFLEKFILDSKFNLIFVSHDRYFIDNIATRIVEVDNAKLTNFIGGYSAYLDKKAQILSALNREHENLVKLLKSELEWLNRGVKARVKRNMGRKNRIDELKAKAKQNPAIIRKMRLELQAEQKHFNRAQGHNAKKCLFEIQNLSKSIDGKILIKDLDLRILQNEKIGVVGKNGSGKSTFLKMLLGQEKADSGIIKKGEVKIAYFDQNLEMLDDDKDLLQTFCPNGGNTIEVQGRNIHIYGYMKNFLFPKEFLDKKIGLLSGGEKKRVALALLLCKKVDLLILDEPTNDLDIATINVLESALMDFGGAIIFVSHDRYFVDKLAQKLLIFKGNGAVEISHQNYGEYLDSQSELDELEILESSFSESKNSQSQKQLDFENLNSERSDSENPKKSQKISYKDKLLLESLPREIDELESQVKITESKLADPKEYEKIGITALAQELQNLKTQLESKIEQYLNLEEKYGA